MNDRFKFRLWHKPLKQMHYNDFIVTATGYMAKIYQQDDYMMKFNQEDLEFDKQCILMQCPGLKDKNGTLIYEGDIVRFIYGNKKRLGYVEENKTVWSITNSNFCQGAWCGGALINLYETCEVIGNIYENKELLEDTECQK